MGSIFALLKDSDKADENGNQYKIDGDFTAEEVYQLLAEIAVYNFGKIYAEQIKKECPEIVQEIKSSEPANLFKNMNDSKKLGLGVFAMAGIDFLPDQNFNALSSLAASLGISTGAMVGILAGVMAIAGGITLSRDINEREIKKLREDEEVIHQYYSDVYKETEKNFDDAMDNLKERVSENLLAYQGADRHHFALINARNILADIKDRITEMYSNAQLESKSIKSLENKIAGYITN